MPDVVTREERALIDAALAIIPPERRVVPAGRTGMPDILWDGERLRLQGTTTGLRGIQAMRANGARAAGIAARARVADRNVRICEDASLGLSYDQLVGKYELSRASIYEIVARAGGCVTPAKTVFAAADGLTSRIKVLANGVRTISEIAQTARCSAHSVRMRRDRFNLDIPFGKSGPKTARQESVT